MKGRDQANVVDVHLESYAQGRAAILALEFDRKAEIGGEKVKVVGFELSEQNLDSLLVQVAALIKERNMMKLLA